MIIGVTFGQIIGGLFWAFLAGFITALAVAVLKEDKKK